MYSYGFETPHGMITVRGNDEVINRLFWGGVPGGDTTPLTRRAEEEILAYFAGTRRAFDMPIEPRGTPFQRRAWREIARIGYGETATYGGLVVALGSGPRAVAGACARNPIPLVIPCHRVLAAGGQLGGYSGGNGLDTKRFLLRLEGVVPAVNP